MLKSRILFGSVFLIALFFALIHSEPTAGFLLLYIMVCLFLIASVPVLLLRRTLGCSESISSESIFKNEELRYMLTIWYARGIFMPKLTLNFYNTGSLDYRAVKRSAAKKGFFKKAVKAEYRVKFSYRGLYEIGLESVTVTDIFGLFSYTCPISRQNRIIVFPERKGDFKLFLWRERESIATNFEKQHEDYTSMSDVRKYVPSDDLRKVHWKLSAKRGDLLVKNFFPFDLNRTLVILNAVRLPLPDAQRFEFEDGIISYVLSSFFFFDRSRLPVEFVYGVNDEKKVAIEPGTVLGDPLRLLAVLPFENKPDELGSCLALIDREVISSMNIVVFTPGMDQAAYGEIMDLLSRRHRVFITYFTYGGLAQDRSADRLIDWLEAAGATVNKVRVEKTVEERPLAAEKEAI
ncbi:MAG: DUF58 domain-containing protein [Clostridiales bacterium]|nr:DUF58 domain-containing protein [Clostridiales bacterium]